MIGYFTIAHSGTQYWRKHYFGDRGDAWKDLGDPLADDVVFAHCNLRHEEAIKSFTGEIVTTVRDPLQMAISWYARGKLDRGYEHWRQAWRIWRECVKPRASVILDMRDAKEAPINSIQHNSLVHYLYREKRFDELERLIDMNEVLACQ